MIELIAGDRVIITKPKYTQGGTSVFLNKIGTIESISGSFLVLVLDGEIDELGFFRCEVDKICDLD